MSRPYYAPKQVYVGTGSLDTYSFDFKIEAVTQLLVVVVDENDVEVQRVRGDDNTYLSIVSITNPPIDGGYVVLLDVLPVNHRIALLQANDEPSQSYEFSNKMSFSLKRFEKALDFITGPIQRLSFQAKQSFRMHDLDDEETFSMQLPPNIAENPDAIFAVNDAGTGLKYGPTTAQIQAWKDAAEAAAAAALASEVASAASEAAAAASAAAAALSESNTAAIAAQALIDINAAEAASIVDINAEEALSIAAINAAEAAALASVAGSTATATAAAVAASASEVAAAASAAAAAASAASVTPKYQFLPAQVLNTNDKLTVDATFPMQMVYVQGNGGDIDLNVLPFVTPPDSGALLTIMGLDNNAIVTLFHNDVDYGFILKGDAYLGAAQCVSVVYDPTLKRYFELNRSV